MQLGACLLPFFAAYYMGVYVIEGFIPETLMHHCLHGLLFWAWVAPLLGVTGALLYRSRSYFGVSLYFLD